MATKGYIAGQRDEAIKKMASLKDKLSKLSGVEFPNFTQYRDWDYSQAMFLQEIASWLSGLEPNEGSQVQVLDVPAEYLTKDGLLWALAQYDIDIDESATKQELFEALQSVK